jgi:hypothetical protein
MAKGGSAFAMTGLEGRRSSVNIDVLWPEPDWVESQVLRIQTKLPQWAINDPDRRFDHLFNLVCDPADFVVAWRRVTGNPREAVGRDRRGPPRCGPSMPRRDFCRGCETISRPRRSPRFLYGNG